MENNHVACSVWRKGDQFWVIPEHTYAGFALHRHNWSRMALPVAPHRFDAAFARLNANRCTYTESLYVLRKFYEKHKQVQISLTVVMI